MEEREIILLPNKYHKWEKEGWYLYFDPANFVWVKVNKDGAQIIDSFRTCNSIQGAIEKIANLYNFKIEEISNSVEKFVAKLIEVGFFHKGNCRQKVFNISLPKYPKALYLHLTNRCNLNCFYCYNKNDRMTNDNLYEMDIDEYLKVIKEAKEIEIKRVVFTGGEPLLYPNYQKVAKFAKELGVKVELLTNGTMINKINSKEIADVFDTITISLDSHLKEDHEISRGQGTFEKVIEGIRLLTDNGAKWVNIATVVTSRNIKNIKEFYRFVLEELRANNVIIQLYIPYVNPITREEKKLLPGFEEIVKIEVEIEKYLHDKEREKIYGKITGIRFQCGAAAGEISMGPNGDIFPCHTLHKKEFLCGNVRKESLKEILETSHVIKIFKDLTVDKIDTCNLCELRYICGGGCRSMAFSVSGRIDGWNSLYCNYLKYDSIRRLWNSSTVKLDDIMKEKSSSEEIENCLD